MPLTGIAPLEVTFTDASSSDVTARLWTFGDGTSSTATNPTNTYATAGVYTISLTITSPSGTATMYDVVTVLDAGAEVAYTHPILAFVNTPGADPQVMLRISNDGGKTWTEELWRSAGKLGEYTKRVSWNRMGSARRRVFEVTMTDPIPWKITGCYLESQVADN